MGFFRQECHFILQGSEVISMLFKISIIFFYMENEVGPCPTNWDDIILYKYTVGNWEFNIKVI